VASLGRRPGNLIQREQTLVGRGKRRAEDRLPYQTRAVVFGKARHSVRAVAEPTNAACPDLSGPTLPNPRSIPKIETRFQRYVFFSFHEALGRCPRLKIECCAVGAKHILNIIAFLIWKHGEMRLQMKDADTATIQYT